ncbi:MAG: twin-arginine translocation signal domain-containing protein [bacterium]|nr:twin-arginine translocation signal domain-containing protein [bacterium]
MNGREISRRDFLKVLAAAGATVAAFGFFPQVDSGSLPCRKPSPTPEAPQEGFDTQLTNLGVKVIRSTNGVGGDNPKATKDILTNTASTFDKSELGKQMLDELKKSADLLKGSVVTKHFDNLDGAEELKAVGIIVKGDKGSFALIDTTNGIVRVTGKDEVSFDNLEVLYANTKATVVSLTNGEPRNVVGLASADSKWQFSPIAALNPANQNEFVEVIPSGTDDLTIRYISQSGTQGKETAVYDSATGVLTIKDVGLNHNLITQWLEDSGNFRAVIESAGKNVGTMFLLTGEGVKKFDIPVGFIVYQYGSIDTTFEGTLAKSADGSITARFQIDAKGNPAWFDVKTNKEMVAPAEVKPLDLTDFPKNLPPELRAGKIELHVAKSEIIAPNLIYREIKRIMKEDETVSGLWFNREVTALSLDALNKIILINGIKIRYNESSVFVFASGPNQKIVTAQQFIGISKDRGNSNESSIQMYLNDKNGAIIGFLLPVDSTLYQKQ